MSRRRNIRQEEDKSDINISPMIDMVFILLIFFIVTTVFVEERGIDADRPQPGASTQENNNPPVKLTLRENGVIVHNGQEISLGAVRGRVSEALQSAATEKPAVIVEAEANVPAGRMVQVIDEATAGGAPKVSVMQATR